jgi:carbon monoxide dehydrogenase subunit G
MKLEQSFEVDAPLERVWQTLIDVEHVAPCLPGAAVTGRNEDGSYNGSFTVKIGPTTASYTGRLEMENIDEASHTATMQAQGTDKRGQGGAKATILSRLAPANGRGTRVDVVTDYHITGRLARFGRGGMIEDISERLLREFAKRLQNSLETQPEAPTLVQPVEPAPAPSEPEPAVAHSEPAVAHSEPAVAHSEPEPTTPAPAIGQPEESALVQPETPVAASAPAPAIGQPQESALMQPETPVASRPTPLDTAAAAPAPADEPTPPPPPSPGPPPVLTPPPPPAAPPPPPGGQAGPGGHDQLEPSEPMQGLALVGGVLWGRVKRNPAPAAAAGVAVVLLMARRRRRRNAWR